MNSNNKHHSFSKQILDFYFPLPKNTPLPNGVKTIYPFDNEETRRVMQTFFDKYYADTKPRT